MLKDVHRAHHISRALLSLRPPLQPGDTRGVEGRTGMARRPDRMLIVPYMLSLLTHVPRMCSTMAQKSYKNPYTCCCIR